MSDDKYTPPRLTKADLTIFTTAAAPIPRPAKKTYDFPLSISSITNLDEAKKNPSYSAIRDFEELRHEESLRIREENMALHLSNEGITDYKIIRTSKSIDFRFSSQWECNIAKMAYLEEKQYIVEFIPTDETMPLAQVRKHFNQLREDFTNSGLNDIIRLQLNRKKRQINAIIPNRRAYVDFLGDGYILEVPKL